MILFLLYYYNIYSQPKLARVPMNKQANVRIMGAEPEVSPLPIERMFVRLPQSKTTCSFCQYFLHYLQVELSDSKTEVSYNVIGNFC